MLAQRQVARKFAKPLAFALAVVFQTNTPLALSDSNSAEEDLVYHFCLKKEYRYSGRVFFSALFASSAEEKEIRSGFSDYVSARYGVDEDEVSCSDGTHKEVHDALLSARKKHATHIVNTQWAAIER